MKKRHKLSLEVIIVLVTWIIIAGILPIGGGHWNQKQIQKIQSVPPADDFCFAVMGDNQDGLDIFEQIIQDINRKKPLFAIDVGDLVFGGEKKKYRIFYREIKKSQVPFLVLPGNHDISNGGLKRYPLIFGDLYYSFNYGDYLFITLNDANQEYIDEQQMEFLENELKKDFKHKFVFLHVPPFEPKTYAFDIPQFIKKRIGVSHSLANKDNAQEFMDLMEQYGVTAVFAGHIHSYFKETRNGVDYFITGGAGGELLRTDSEHYFYHYINVCVDEDQIDYQVVGFPSPDGQKLDRLIHAAGVFIWYWAVINKKILIIAAIVLVLAFDFFLDTIDGIKQRSKKILSRRRRKPTAENSDK